MQLERTLLAAAIAALPLTAVGSDRSLDEVVVTAPQMREPLVVVNDPKAPQQPVPASDGASFLKNIPGFNVIRKGGTDGDPVLRGLAGSRLNVLLDGAEFHGGCGMRMDPPTAYVFPEAYDRVTVVKGPQTVLHGNGNLAGVVLFERDTKPFTKPGVRGHASLMGGSWGRLDGFADATYGGTVGYLRAIATHSESDDYRDGDGRRINSAYARNSLTVVGGWTPGPDTTLQLSATRSEAEAAYADRGMDGSVFDRDGYSLKFEHRNVSETLRRIELRADYNYIDHVMDNYSLRPKPAGASYSWSNPDRETIGLRAAADFALGANAVLTAGVDRQENEHTVRQGSGPTPVPIGSRPRMSDFESSTTGVFGELVWRASDRARWIAGLRRDGYSAQRFVATSGAANGSVRETLASGFLRYEHDAASMPLTAYLGFGHAERGLDHWEATTYNALSAARAARPERNDQLDAGLVWNGDALTGSLSLFHSRISDYLLTYVNPDATGSCSSNPQKCATFNVDAARHGLEADLAWRFAPGWTLRGSLAQVRADNRSMGVALAQTPPAEAKLGLSHASGPWQAGGVLRMVARQDRVHPNHGSIVGQDIGPTGGFATLALHASYRIGRRVLLAGGIDNVFDRTYAEHISRTAVAVAGYDAPTTRVNEPGRFVWLKVSFAMD